MIETDAEREEWGLEAKPGCEPKLSHILVI